MSHSPVWQSFYVSLWLSVSKQVIMETEEKKPKQNKLQLCGHEVCFSTLTGD